MGARGRARRLRPALAAGYLRHLVIREGVRTGELLAILVTAAGDVPGVELLPERLPEGVVGVVHAVNEGVAEVTGGLPVRTLIGRDWYSERIGGLELRVTAGAFLQTNTIMAERLYGIAIELAAPVSTDVAWDLYCGTGTIGLLAARAGAGRVYGIDVVPESIERARENATRNGVRRAEFVAGDVARAVRPLLERAPRPTLVFVDPPRAGLTPKAVRRLVELEPERIVYVSCNPTTLAPNGRQLEDAGWHAGRRAAGGHVPAHAPHRVRRALQAGLSCAGGSAGSPGSGTASGWSRCASWTTPSAIRGAGRE